MTDLWLPRATRVIQVFSLADDDDVAPDDSDVVLVVEAESGEHIHLRLSRFTAMELSDLLVSHLQMDPASLPWELPPDNIH